jgi:membrane-bound lytic murein transglycosylase D
MRSLACLLLVWVAGCAAKPVVVATAPSAPAAPVQTPAPSPVPPDPVAAAVARAEAAFAVGRTAIADGHLQEARQAFDRAVDELLTLPGGTRSDERVSAALDGLIDRISALELAALASGDGFTETASEPASIDTLLSLPPAEAEAPPAPEVGTAVRANLATVVHDIPIPLNDRVLRFVELFQGRLRDFLAEGLARGAPHLPMILTVFRQEGLPLDLAFVPLVESAFKPTAVSRASARGVWQFMRGTGTENGLKQDWYIDERADPEKATRAAARYLKTLHRLFGDWHLALASYNGGPGRVQRAIRRSGLTDFWRLSASSRVLPRETRDYVPMILAATIIARNPGQYGFDVPSVLPFATDIVTFSRPVDLRRIAEWAGVSADDIRGLNPELRRWTTPVRSGDYQVRVPLGTMATVLEGYQGTSPDDSASLQWHTVKKGESLPTIARRLGVSRLDLADANYLKSGARVAPGQRLVVPRAPSAALLAGRSALGTGPVASSGETDGSPIVYRVRKGDTLSAIARRHGVSIENLRTWNGLKGSVLGIGDRLQIHAPRPAVAQ